MIKEVFLLTYLGYMGYEDYRKKSLSIGQLAIGVLLGVFISIYNKTVVEGFLVGILFIGAGLIFKFVFSQGLGMGDVIIFFILGMVLGLEKASITLLISCVVLVIVGSISWLLRSHFRLFKKEGLAFLPFIELAYIIILVKSLF